MGVQRNGRQKLDEPAVLSECLWLLGVRDFTTPMQYGMIQMNLVQYLMVGLLEILVNLEVILVV